MSCKNTLSVEGSLGPRLWSETLAREREKSIDGEASRIPTQFAG